VQSWAGAGYGPLFRDMRKMGIFAKMHVTGGLGDREDPDLFTGGGFATGVALVEALRRTEGDPDAEALIRVMEGMSFGSFERCRRKRLRRRFS
jgi:hypothetical protein